MAERDRILVVGLGNPGPRYAGNRHNVGFMVLDQIAAAAGISLSRKSFKGIYGTGDWEGQSLVLLKPDTFMNLSGQSVSPARSFFDVPIPRILVLHDELDLPFGEVRGKVGGGLAGHNGLKSIAQVLGTQDFLRARIGIGRPPGRQEVSSYVLSGFSSREKDEVSLSVSRAADLVEAIVTLGVETAMNRFHGQMAGSREESPRGQ